MTIAFKKIIRFLHHSKIRFPLLSNYASKKFITLHYKNEIEMYYGKKNSSCCHKSVAFFTVHKAGSEFASSVMRAIAKNSGFECIHYAAYIFSGGKLPLRYDQPGNWSKNLYPQNGYFFGPFRKFHGGIPWLSDNPLIFHIRDPRDVLVSLYYSLKTSHYIPYSNKKAALYMLERRKTTAQMEIDEFVLEEAHRIKSEYLEYFNGFSSHNNICISKYEEMVDNFEAWFLNVCRGIGINESDQLINICHKKRPGKVLESEKSHKRQVTPGDHRRKLSKSTISELDSILKEVLIKCKYD